MTVPVNTAVAVPAGKNFDRKPDFTLDKRGQVVSLTAADPAMSHRVWRNADDLSAKIYLGEADGAMHMLVKVTDDKHHQPYSGFEVWATISSLRSSCPASAVTGSSASRISIPANPRSCRSRLRTVSTVLPPPEN